jgi:predicted HTH transcriptional regulator
MISDEQLLERLKDPEDLLTERKSQGVSNEDICKTLVAFANSVPDDRHGILFVGISDKGDLAGVENPDKLQKDIQRLAETRCYPPISVQCRQVLLRRSWFRLGTNRILLALPLSE